MLTPKLFTVLREGYGFAELRADALAGLTVAIVALPLSMAIAIASHAPPEAGLITAIVGGFIISAFGGSRYQIGGPAGAFIVLVAATIDRFGYDGLLLATMIAGALMLLAGVLRLGGLVRLVPPPVVAGFTAAIAVIIAASQVKAFLGLSLAQAEPAALVPKLMVLARAIATVSWQTAGLGFVTVALILGLRAWRPHWPAFIIATLVASLISKGLSLDAATIGSQFGGIGHGLPTPRLPTVDGATVWAVLPTAISIMLLGSIESLLSAVVADAMKGRRHRSNAELVAQGLANIVTPVFGGITATGTIARTATNVRAGAHGPVSGMLHAVYLLAAMLVAAPMASYIPLTALSAILLVVCWNMADRKEIAHLLRGWSTALPLVTTFLVTLFVDLLAGIACGTILSHVLTYFSRRSDMGRT